MLRPMGVVARSGQRAPWVGPAALTRRVEPCWPWRSCGAPLRTHVVRCHPIALLSAVTGAGSCCPVGRHYRWLRHQGRGCAKLPKVVACSWSFPVRDKTLDREVRPSVSRVLTDRLDGTVVTRTKRGYMSSGGSQSTDRTQKRNLRNEFFSTIRPSLKR